MTPEYKTALIRGVIGAVILAGVSFFALAAVDLAAAGIAAGAAAFGYLAQRFGVEGTLDSNRARGVPLEQAGPNPHPGPDA